MCSQINKSAVVGGMEYIMENTINPEIFEDNGTVNISDEVIAVMASLAATGVKGVAGMAGGVVGGIAELLGKKSLSKGVKITKDGESLVLDMDIVVEYGTKIPEISWEVQDKVKSEIETMTGLLVSTVNVNVEGINVSAEEKNPQKEETTEE